MPPRAKRQGARSRCYSYSHIVYGYSEKLFPGITGIYGYLWELDSLDLPGFHGDFHQGPKRF